MNDTFEFLREEELLDENNEWFCENCKKKQRAKKKIEIYNAPKILIIQLKRFSQINKINTKVNFPLTDFDISQYILSKEKENEKNMKYDLFAVANHYGSLYFGHYTAFCKNSITNKWYEFNDSSVNEIKDESNIVSKNAYVLFYRRKGLSKLNWKNIYNKNFIDIDINNPSTLVDFNYDYIINENNIDEINNNENGILNNEIKNGSEKDINEFDIVINDIYRIKRLEKNIQESTIKQNEEKKDNINFENRNNNNENYKNNEITINEFLNKKRASPDN